VNFPSPLVGEGDSARSVERGEGARRPPKAPASPTAIPLVHARTMRGAPTDAERALWRLLRDRRLVAWKFRRQVVVGRYIADFVCFEARLVVEADGGQHCDSAGDAARTAWFRNRGFRVIRFRNNEILGNLDGVVTAILLAIADPSPRSAGAESPSPARGEGKEGLYD